MPRTRQERERQYRLRKEALSGYLSTQRCADCGSEQRLQLDHRDDTTKLFNPSDVGHRAWTSLWDEWAKCDVRCVSCHARRHIYARVAS